MTLCSSDARCRLFRGVELAQLAAATSLVCRWSNGRQLQLRLPQWRHAPAAIELELDPIVQRLKPGHAAPSVEELGRAGEDPQQAVKLA